MFTKTTTPCCLLACLALAAVFAAPLAAQTVTATYNRNYGNSEIGGRVELLGQARRTTGFLSERADTLGQARALVRVGTVQREAARVRHTGFAERSGTINYMTGRSSYSYRAGAALTVDIGGSRVVSRSRSYTGTLSGYVTPNEIYAGAGIDRAYAVGPFVLTSRQQVSAGASYGIEATLSSSQRLAAADGYARTWANGSSTLAVGIPGIQAGVTSTLRFANTRLDIDLLASPTQREARIDFTFNAIRLFTELFVEVWPARWTNRIIDLSMGSFSGFRQA